MNPVVVDWMDAFIDTDDFSQKEADRTEPVRRYTVGWFVSETDEGVVLATDYYDKLKDGYAARMFIPWGMINEWYDL
jgi:hypothetical protein